MAENRDRAGDLGVKPAVEIDRNQVEQALSNGEFAPHFQPIVVLRTGQLAGFEVLARWHHPALGTISPGLFLPIAERDAWINSLTERLLASAFSFAHQTPANLWLAVNISPMQLRDSTLPTQIRQASNRTGFDLNRLMVEVTEGALIDNLEGAFSITQELKSMGCRLALDDFGTGHSSLLHLQALPFDYLKIDRSFVGSMTNKRESRKIVEAVVGLGQSLGLTTIAEGIETEQQAEMMHWLGCEMGQGWLYGRPVSGEELQKAAAAYRQAASADPTHPWKNMTSANLDLLPAQRLAQLQAIYDGAPVGLAFVDQQLRYVNLNQKLAQMNGAPLVDHIGSRVEEMVPELFPLIEPMLRRALAGEAIPEFEATIPLSGETRQLSYQPARDEANEVVGVSISIWDTTTQKKALDTMRDSVDRYRTLVELNPQILWVMDRYGQVLDIYPGWNQTIEAFAKETRGRGWLDSVHPHDLQTVLDAVEGSALGGAPINMEYRARGIHGDWRWVRSRGTPRFDESGIVQCWYGGTEDITELMANRQELIRAEWRLQAVLDALPFEINESGVFEFDEEPSGNAAMVQAALRAGRLPN